MGLRTIKNRTFRSHSNGFHIRNCLKQITIFLAEKNKGIEDDEELIATDHITILEFQTYLDKKLSKNKNGNTSNEEI